VFASYLIRIAPDQTRLWPPFLSLFFNWQRTQERLKGLASRAVSQSNISAGKLKGFLVPVPRYGEQEEISAVLRACDAKIAAGEREAQVLDELFRALLEELMTGRLSAAPLIEPEAAP
jgi:type I restriction enzyme S subunit